MRRNSTATDRKDDERSQKPVAATTQEEQSSNVSTATAPKPLKNEPFIKSLFAGRYVYDYLKFPEYARNDELNDMLETRVEPLRDYLTNTSRPKITSGGTNYTPEAIESMRTLGLFGMSLPTASSGLDLDATSMARMVEECGLNGYSGLAVQLIYTNEVAAKLIKVYGSPTQHDKYLKSVPPPNT